MDHNPFAPAFDDLPETLPVFPLPGVLLLPCGRLPLNIFEPRYLAMVEDALAGPRMIGMIQPKESGNGVRDLYHTGCAGKITEFSETQDGRYLISLTGICRFNIEKELDTNRGYRRIKPDWSVYEEDFSQRDCLDLDRDKLKTMLKTYFDKEGMSCDWEALDSAPDGKLMTCLSMICPFEPSEKQALLEAGCCERRARMFMAMLEMAVESGAIDLSAQKSCH